MDNEDYFTKKLLKKDQPSTDVCGGGVCERVIGDCEGESRGRM